MWTPPWRCWPSAPRTFRRKSPPSSTPPTGSWPRRSGSAATGPSGARGSRRAAGPSSTTTTSIPTSTTPPSSHSRSRSSATAGLPSSASAAGWPACSRRTAAGAPSRRQRRRVATRSLLRLGAVPIRRRPTYRPRLELSRASRATRRTSPRERHLSPAEDDGSVRPMGRQLRLRRAACCPRSRPGFTPRPSRDPRASRAGGPPERRRRLRRGLPLVRPR